MKSVDCELSREFQHSLNKIAYRVPGYYGLPTFSERGHVDPDLDLSVLSVGLFWTSMRSMLRISGSGFYRYCRGFDLHDGGSQPPAYIRRSPIRGWHTPSLC